MELFAGQAECTRMFRYADLPSARLDLLYMNSNDNNQNPMDLLSDAGMVTLGKVWKIILWVGSEIRMTCGIKLCQQLCLVSISTCLHPSPRTALAVVLQGDHDAGWLAHYALKCSSWVATNAGTSSRSACSSIGNTEFQSVRDANCLGSRIFDCIS